MDQTIGTDGADLKPTPRRIGKMVADTLLGLIEYRKQEAEYREEKFKIQKSKPQFKRQN